MKRLIKGSVNPQHKIVITLELDEYYAEIAAERHIDYRGSISKKYQLSDSQLTAYSDFVDSIMNEIDSHGFYIINEYQSSNSYSYYAVFYPVTDDGERLDAIEFEFRISDHNNKSYGGRNSSSSSHRLFKSFLMGDKKYTSTYTVMMEVSKICDELKTGNYDVLNEFEV